MASKTEPWKRQVMSSNNISSPTLPALALILPIWAHSFSVSASRHHRGRRRSAHSQLWVGRGETCRELLRLRPRRQVFWAHSTQPPANPSHLRLCSEAASWHRHKPVGSCQAHEAPHSFLFFSIQSIYLAFPLQNT